LTVSKMARCAQSVRAAYLNEHGNAMEWSSRIPLLAFVIQEFRARSKLISRRCGNDSLEPVIVAIDLLETCVDRIDGSQYALLKKVLKL
jgi:hypothetical protein